MIERYKPAKAYVWDGRVLIIIKIKRIGYGARIFSYVAATFWNDFHKVDLKKQAL